MSENCKNRVVYRDHNTQYPRWVIAIERNVSKPPPQFVMNNLTKEVSDNTKSEHKIIQPERSIYARKAKKNHNNYWKKNVDYVCMCVATFINATMDGTLMESQGFIISTIVRKKANEKWRRAKRNFLLMRHREICNRRIP